jgi:hypothetical protein
MEISLRIHEPDPDQRNAEILRLLAVVARQRAEASGVDWQRLMQRELRREVRNRPVHVRIPVLPPRIARAARRIERIYRRVEHGEELVVGGRQVQHFLRDQPEHQHRIVRGLAPQGVIEFAEHLAGLRVPGPPEIHGQLGQPVEALRDGRRFGCAHVAGRPLVKASGRRRQTLDAVFKPATEP